MNRIPPKNIEEWGTESVADWLSRGRLGMYSRFAYLFMKVFAACGLVWTRFRIGSHMITGGTVFWIGSIMGLLSFLTTLAGATVSVGPIFVLWLGSFGLAVLHMLEAFFNIRGKKPRPRHGFDPGRSWIWQLIKWPLRWIGLAHAKGKEPRWYQLSEWRWIRFFEPVLIMVVGWNLAGYGLVAFGNMVLLIGAMMFMHLQFASNRYYEMIQSMWDADVTGRAVQKDALDKPRGQEEGGPIESDLPKPNPTDLTGRRKAMTRFESEPGSFRN